MTPACADNKLVMLRVIPSPSLPAATSSSGTIFVFFPLPCLVTLEITRCDCRRPPHAGAVPELVWSACRVRVHMCACVRACTFVCKGNKGIIVGCRCVLVPGSLQRRICRTMALCSSTHLSQRGEVRGPDRCKITKEQTSLNPRGGTGGLKEGVRGRRR